MTSQPNLKRAVAGGGKARNPQMADVLRYRGSTKELVPLDRLGMFSAHATDRLPLPRVLLTPIARKATLMWKHPALLRLIDHVRSVYSKVHATSRGVLFECGRLVCPSGSGIPHLAFGVVPALRGLPPSDYGAWSRTSGPSWPWPVETDQTSVAASDRID